MNGIKPIGIPSLESLEGRSITGPQKTNGTHDIGGSFTKALGEARGLENQATDAAEKFANGDTSIGIHEVMITTEKANIAVRYATTLKNKAIEAYKELMNTQV